MAAYFIFSHKVHDANKLNNEYLPKAIETLKPYDPGILVVDENIEVVESDTSGTNDTRTVVLKFKNRAEARQWYDSPEYQSIIHLRQQAVEGRAMLCDEFDPTGT